MTTQNVNDSLKRLRTAFREGNLSLYLGAGVSVGNGLPTWDKLVLAMYFSAINEEAEKDRRPFPNYLFAIAEWHLNRGHEPLDITARRLRKYYDSDDKLLTSLRRTLYAGFTSNDNNAGFQPMEAGQLRAANPTLDAVATFCENSVPGKKGVQAVITENYDSLLEIALGKHPFQPIWNSSPAQPNKLPIYHVHGYVPVEENLGSTADEIIFTEEQYYSATHETYSWSNLVQLQRMSSSIGLMVGLSLSDRNLRRLLDAVMRPPLHCEKYALLIKPRWKRPADRELDQIHRTAIKYLNQFRKSGVKTVKGTPQYRVEIAQILRGVERLDIKEQTFVLNQLGVQPIWYSNHAEIPSISRQYVKGVNQPETPKRLRNDLRRASNTDNMPALTRKSQKGTKCMRSFRAFCALLWRDL